MDAELLNQLKRIYDSIQECWLTLDMGGNEWAFKLAQYTLRQLQELIDQNQDELGALSYYVEEAKQSDPLIDGLSDILEQLNMLGVDVDE